MCIQVTQSLTVIGNECERVDEEKIADDKNFCLQEYHQNLRIDS